MMNTTFFSRNTLLASIIFSLFSVGCGGGGSSTGAVSQAPALFTIVEYSFDQDEDITEFTPENMEGKEEEDFENILENALLSRHWIFLGTSLQEGNSSLGNSLSVLEIPELKNEEFSDLVTNFTGRINVGALVIGDKNATRLKYVGVQSFNEITSDLKTFTLRIHNGDLPETEGGLMMLVLGLEGAKGFAASPAIEIPQGDIKITFTCWEDSEGKIYLDNLHVQADNPAPTQYDCPELMDFFYTIRDMAEEMNSREEEEEETNESTI